MPGTKTTLYDPARLLEAAGVAHRMVQAKAGHVFFS
jgi:CRP/FNR family cyclic AMP-dependent transcriptional regulator